MKCNDNKIEKIILPMPPEMQEARFEMEVYVRFMRHLRCAPTPRFELKILQAIQFTADMLDVSEEILCKTLVDLGLRAPRFAFPASYLNFADQSLMRGGLEVGAATETLKELQTHWNKLGEARLLSQRNDMPFLGIPANTDYPRADIINR